LQISVAAHSTAPGLFSIRSTGVSIGPVRESAVRFLATLNAEQRKATVFRVDDDGGGGLDGTYFVWIGGTEDDSVYYYRIQSPVILIEFDHQTPIGLRHLQRTDSTSGSSSNASE
jgi:hypothetical protein